jgi:hypothetical protein
MIERCFVKRFRDPIPESAWGTPYFSRQGAKEIQIHHKTPYSWREESLASQPRF